MKFALDVRSGVNLIRAYGPGEVRIGERRVQGNCVVAADALITDWPATSFTQLDVPQLEPIFDLKPEIVLVGTGPAQQFPSAPVRAAFAARGIGLETMDLGAACRTFNILVQEERRVVAALFVN